MQPPPSPSAASPRVDSAPASTRQSQWVICRLRTPPSVHWYLPNCAGNDCRCGSPPCPLFPTLINVELVNAEGLIMTTLYTSDHEWLRIEGDVATIGVTDYAQSQLGDVVFVELPKVGRSLKKAEAAAWSNRSRQPPTFTRRFRAKCWRSIAR